MSASISNSFKTIHLPTLIPIDFNSIPNLPDSHAWKPSSAADWSADPLVAADSVPVIDICDPNAISQIRHACEKWGAFQITNYGIPSELFLEVELHSNRLFSLPADDKLKVVRSPEGLTGYGLVPIAPFFKKQMWSEGFAITGSPVEHARQLWPDDHAKFCTVMEEYQKQMKGLSEKILDLVLGSLGLTHEDIKWIKPNNKPTESEALLQLNSYPVCPDPNRAMGMAPHTDSSLLTFLYQNNTTQGLEVHRDGIGWVRVQPAPGALVVNLGDLMHILSNGRLKSALHRAVVNQTQHRISVVYFYGPPKDLEISPMVKLVDHAHPCLFRPVTWKEYREIRASHFDNAIEFLKN
ncbi:hypothetical protein UlMin_022321 [Ulmus minor]